MLIWATEASVHCSLQMCYISQSLMFLKHARRKIFRNGVKTNVTFFFFSLPNKWQTFLYLARLIICASPPFSLPTSLQMSFVAFPWRLASYGNIRSWKIKDMVGIKEVWRLSPAPKQDPEGLEIHSSVSQETGFGSSAGSCIQGGAMPCPYYNWTRAPLALIVFIFFP